MEILKLEVENWKGVRSASLDFDSGLTVVSGPNESGKSSLREALLAAFCWDTGSTRKDLKALAPWDGSGSPRTEVEFRHQGSVWKVTKNFLRRSDHARLERGGRLVARDKRVNEVLEGLPELDWLSVLWGTQGILKPLKPAPPPTSLKARLQNAVGSTLSPEVLALQAQVDDHYGRFFTPGRGELVKRLKDLRQRCIEREERVEALRRQMREVELAGEHLGTLSGQLERLERGLAPLRERLAQDQAALERWSRYRLEVEKHQLALTRFEAASRYRQEVQQILADLRAAEPAFRQLKERLQALDGLKAPSRAALEAVEREKEYLELRLQADLQARLSQLKVPDVKALRTQSQQLEVLQGALEAGALKARVMVQGAGPARVKVDGALHQVTDTQDFAPLGRLEVELPGQLSVIVEAPSQDLAEQGRRRWELQQQFQAALAACECADLEAAEERLDEIKALRSQLRESGDLTARLQAVRPEQLSGDTLEQLARRLVQETQAYREAQRAYEAESQERDRLSRQRESSPVVQLLSKLAARLEQGVEGLDRFEAQVPTSQEFSLKSLSSLEEALQRLPWPQQLEHLSAQVKQAQARAQRPEGPEVSEASLAAQKLELERREDERTALCDRIASLRGELKGRAGLFDRLTQAREELQRAEDEASEQLDQAYAWHMLREELASARSALETDVSGPLQERIGRRLAALTAGRYEGVVLHRDFTPGQVAWRQQAQPVELLSYGTQEQLTFLAKLCLAELLSTTGGRQLIVLDDNLVHTDQARMLLSCQLLEEVAESAQVVVFTCHPERYHFRGPVKTHRLGDDSSGSR